MLERDEVNEELQYHVFVLCWFCLLFLGTNVECCDVEDRTSDV